MRNLSMLKSWRARGDETLFARAIPQKVQLTEAYAVDQEISRNPAIQQDGEGTGRIEVAVPYDGRDHFTRQAVADVQRVLGPHRGTSEQRATIGHLLLADHTNTTGLRGVMRPHNQAGLIPLSVPAATSGGTLDLTGDRQTCVLSYDYQPGNPPVYPIDIDVQLGDLDSLIDPFDDEKKLADIGRENPSSVIEKLRQEASFSSSLLLRFVVRISIPVKAGYPVLTPVVTSMSLEWPTLTSLRSTRLRIANLESQGPRSREASFRYNPAKSRLEWKDVPMSELSGGPGREAGTRVFDSAPVLLKIGHPGELFKEDKLEVNAARSVPYRTVPGRPVRRHQPGADRLRTASHPLLRPRRQGRQSVHRERNRRR